MVKKNTTMWATIGSLLVIISIILTIPLSINKEYIYMIILTGLAGMIGVLIIIWALTD